MDGVLPFLLRTPIRQGHDAPRQFLLVALGLPLSSSDVFLLDWALGLIIRNGPGYPGPLAPQIVLVSLILDKHTCNGKNCFTITNISYIVLIKLSIYGDLVKHFVPSKGLVQ